MDISLVKAVLSGLDLKMERAREARRQIEREEGRKSKGEEVNYPDGSFEEPKEALVSLLEEIHEILLVELEALELHKTRQRFVEKWKNLEEAHEIGKMEYSQRYDSLGSKP